MRVLAVFLLAACMFPAVAQSADTSNSGAGKATFLDPDQTAKLLPPSVYFQGKTAAVQARNSAGAQWGDGAKTLATLIDNSGYASNVQQKFQAYLITEVPIAINHKLLPAGAYGFGFEDGGGFVIMDVGGNDIFVVEYQRDPDFKRPKPLQMIADPVLNGIRLYAGRAYVTIERAGRP